MGAERRIAPKALDKFKAQIRDMTRRTLGSLALMLGADDRGTEAIPYRVARLLRLCQTPRVLTNLEAWIQRRVRAYIWRQWQNGLQPLHGTAPSWRTENSQQRSRPVHRRDSGECQDTRPFNRLCATPTSIQFGLPAFMWSPKLNLIEPPWYGPVCPVGVGGAVP